MAMSTGCRVLLRLQIFSLDAPDLAGQELNIDENSILSLQLKRGKKLNISNQGFSFDPSTGSINFKASLSMCATLFADGMGSYYDCFGKLSVSFGDFIGVAAVPFHAIQITDDEHQQLSLPVVFSQFESESCSLNVIALATFVEDVYQDVVSIISETESTDEEDVDDVVETFNESADNNEDDGFYGKSLVSPSSSPSLTVAVALTV